MTTNTLTNRRAPGAATTQSHRPDRRAARRAWTIAIAVGLIALGASTAQAHGAKHPGSPAAQAPAEQKAWGIAAPRRSAGRTIDLVMLDTMRFVPDRFEVREGETVRLRLRNRGRLRHELVLGTRTELEAHAALMQKFPEMEHDEAHMSHVAAGRSGEIVWHFNRPGDFEFACLIPGHFQSGMSGRFRVVPR